jgi:hypothetical protein
MSGKISLLKKRNVISEKEMIPLWKELFYFLNSQCKN